MNLEGTPSCCEGIREPQAKPGQVDAVVVRDGFFACDPAAPYFETHDTAEAAKADAEALIQIYRDTADEGWSDDAQNVCWGIVKQRAGFTGHRPVTEDDAVAPGIDEWCDCELGDVE